MMLAERRITEELMDDPALPPETYCAVLADLAAVNRITLAHRPTLNFIEQAIGNRNEFSLLDVGFGHGDLLRTIARWALQRGVKAHLYGVDLNPNSASVALAATSVDMPIAYLTGDYRDHAAGHDLIVSSLVAHHMSHEQLTEFLRVMQREARLGWFVNDLHRHALSYLGYPILARLMGWHPIVRSDGRTSIARSYRPAEWHALLGEAGVTDAHVTRFFPFRLCASRLR